VLSGAVYSACVSECVYFVGHVFVLLNVVNVISAVTKCYPVNGQQYCFHTDGSVLTKDESYKFCMSRISTLPVITDKDIDNVFQRFINDSVDVSGSDAEQMNNSVWLDAQARHVDDSVPWHWIGSNQPSSKLTYYTDLFIKLLN